MKIYIGPYVDRWVSRLHHKYMDSKYGYVEWDENKDWKDRFVEKIDDVIQVIYNNTVNLYLDRKKRKIKVKIDRWDTWGMDETLSYIVVPMLKQLKETKHGSPYVDDSDVPEHLRSTSAPPKENDYDIDDLHHERWDWVLSEMIWAFEQASRDWESDYYEYEHFTPNKDSKDFSERLGCRLVWQDKQGSKDHLERMQNGFRLFGTYYLALWD